MKRKKQTSKHKRGTQAKRADKYALYQESVQSPEPDVDFLIRIFKKRHGRVPHTLREDFCGTAGLSCEFVGRHVKNRAWGVDLDPEPLAWGREHNRSKLSPSASERLELIEGNVLDPPSVRVDAAIAFNFSYCIFKKRSELLAYFKVVHEGLKDDGLFAMDLYGGSEAQSVMSETLEKDGFDYVWDQHRFDPIQHGALNYIHFEFPDGSRMERAYSYDWRLWTIPELRDLLVEAGFSETEVYWEGTDRRTGEGNGVYKKRERGDDDPAWVVYIVGVK